jgi:hypothetical protein
MSDVSAQVLEQIQEMADQRCYDTGIGGSLRTKMWSLLSLLKNNTAATRTVRGATEASAWLIIGLC